MVTLDPLLREDWETRLESNIAALGLPRRMATVIQLLVLGLSTAEIAAEMGIGESTVKNQVTIIGHELEHRGFAARALGATSRSLIVAVMIGTRT